MTDDYSQAEIVRSLRRIETKVDQWGTSHVSRVEWTVWSEARDREIRDLKARSAPWWTWATVLVAAVSLATTLIPRLAAGG